MTNILLSPPSAPLKIPEDYPAAVRRAGAEPLFTALPPEDFGGWDSWALEEVSRADAVVLIGGPDIDPEIYGERRMDECGPVVPARDMADLAIARAALALGMPVLALCRGLQVLNVALDGTLYQDVPAQTGSAITHQTKEPEPHGVRVAPGTLLHAILGADSLPVSSRHHQAVKMLGRGLLISAVSADGIIEAVEFIDRRPVVGVQWHPETLAAERPAHQALFGWLARAAKERA